MTDKLAQKTIDAWADDEREPVALHLKQKLLPVEGDPKVIFPPTYADIGYNIDTLSDNKKVAMIDSVGSQANRMEPIFKDKPYSELVPQIEIELRTETDDNDKQHAVKVSLLDLAHRSADAVVHASPELVGEVTKAFHALNQNGDAGPLCRIAPTSLVFGFWDSRGESNEKRPRLVRSIIRAWDVEPLHTAAQFNSVWKLLDEGQKNELKEKAKSIKKNKGKDLLSKAGFTDVPSVSPGGVLANGKIERDVTVNLIALRALRGKNNTETRNIRRYLLALTLIAATCDIELFLREGCLLRFADDDSCWQAIPRRGEPIPIDLASEQSQKTLLTYAEKAVEPFKTGWPKKRSYKYNIEQVDAYLYKVAKAKNEESAG